MARLAMPSSVRGCSSSEVVYRLVLCSSAAMFYEVEQGIVAPINIGD
jgi:hypothetical protein